MNLISDFLVPLTTSTLVFVSALCAQAPAKTPSKPADPAVEALLAKVAANMGVPAGTKATSIVIEGTYTVTFKDQSEPMAKGPFRELFAGADLARSTMQMGEFGAMERGIYKDTTWEVDPSMGAKVHRGVNAAATRRWFALLRGEDPRNTYREFTKTGTQVIDGRELTVLRMTAAEGKPDVWYVDADGTVARIDIALPSPESADATFAIPDLMDTEMTFADWQKVDGGRFPMRSTLRMGPAKVSSVRSKITVGAEIDPARFAPPDAVAKVVNEPTVPAFTPEGAPTYQIVDRAGQPVASIRVKIKPADISGQLAILLPEVWSRIRAAGAKEAGPPFSRYHSVSDTEIDLEAGIPVKKPFEEKGRVKNSELPAGRAVTCWHIGPYEKLTDAHAGLRAHLAEKKLKARGGVWEVYWTDPGMVPDQSKWRTQLFAPIE
ncbi:MAG TPA: GyrI-like domain-containing protein [Planctomycetota bacterium]|nr:GyrI-like domain-containing protein [Planctomycetota bacterium]